MKNSFAIASVVVLEMYRRKDFYVLFFLTVLITGLMGSVTFFNDPKIARYLKEICLGLIWISSLFIAIATTARQIPAERESRTIFPLMAKPVSRGQVLLGKFLGCWFATCISLVVFYLFFGIVAGAKEHHWPVASYFQAWSLHCVMLAVVIGYTLLGSLVLSSVAANITLSAVATAGILFVGRHLNKVAASLGEVQGALVSGIYYAIPHLELFDVRDLIVHKWPLIGWNIWGVATLYALVYAALLLFVTWLVFRRKAFQ
jgi:ABC-type transport system involved in multi-copper enzyme maturation permease subunit